MEAYRCDFMVIVRPFRYRLYRQVSEFILSFVFCMNVISNLKAQTAAHRVKKEGPPSQSQPWPWWLNEPSLIFADSVS
jgi:hypothetical protein